MKKYRNSLNLYNKDGTDPDKGYVATGKALSNTNTLLDNDYFCVSEYMPISPTYSILSLSRVNTTGESVSICFYDSEKNFIIGYRYNGRSEFSVNIPSNAYFFRASIIILYLNSAMICYNGVKPYEPYNVVDWYTTGYRRDSNGAWGAAKADKKYSGGEWE